MSPAPAGARAARRRQLLAVWVVVAVGFGALLLLSSRAESSLDDPDPARQRPGFLDADSEPFRAPRVGSVPMLGRRAVVFFARPAEVSGLVRSLRGRSSLCEDADVGVVVSSGNQPTGPVDAAVVDRGGRIAARYGMPKPRDGGPPVGYTIVDRHGRVRYRTLDPGLDLDEVDTILAATP